MTNDETNANETNPTEELKAQEAQLRLIKSFEIA